MVKSISDILDNITLGKIVDTCNQNEKISAIIKKYARDDFKFKMTDSEILIKTCSAMEKWELSSQGSMIIAEINELLEKKLKLKCSVVPKL